MKKLLPYLSWGLRIVAAGILFQSLYFKFTAHPDAVFICSELGIEPWGRIGLGVVELITAILILLPTTVGLGALLGETLMMGAIVAHVAVLGVEVNNDRGSLFSLALITLLACAILLVLHRKALLASMAHIVSRNS
jgi:hypothetical protein